MPQQDGMIPLKRERKAISLRGERWCRIFGHKKPVLRGDVYNDYVVQVCPRCGQNSWGGIDKSHDNSRQSKP